MQEPSGVRITIRARVQPTEIADRVREAALNMFPDADVEVAESEVSATTTSLDRLAELIANHRIPDTARGVMLGGRSSRDAAVTRFTLGKQAAFMGRPHFAPPEGPLGELEVEVAAESTDALEATIYRAAPDTTVAPELATVPPSKRPAEDPPGTA